VEKVGILQRIVERKNQSRCVLSGKEITLIAALLDMIDMIIMSIVKNHDTINSSISGEILMEKGKAVLVGVAVVVVFGEEEGSIVKNDKVDIQIIMLILEREEDMKMIMARIDLMLQLTTAAVEMATAVRINGTCMRMHMVL
jgi:hypothetical protein